MFFAGYKYGHVRLKISDAQRDKMMKIIQSLNKSPEEFDALMEIEFPEVISMCGNVPRYVEFNSRTIKYLLILIYILCNLFGRVVFVLHLLIFHCNSED